MTSTGLYPARTSASSFSLETASLPPYSEFPEDLAAAAAGPSRSGSPESLPDASDPRGPAPAPAPFAPTTQLQIETPGKPWFSLPGPPRPAPVPVYALGPDGRPLPRPLYRSLRPARRSGSCVLVRGDADEDETPLVATTYRFGVGRPPQIQLLDGAVCELASPRLLSRAQRVEVPGLGVFEWRYAGARERRAEGRGADSLLVMERVAVVEETPSTTTTTTGPQQQQQQSPSSSSSSSPPHTRTRIAQLVRSADLRTPGTSRTAAGNGGRLMLDLRAVDDEKARERVQLLAVATALVMLKKEVDRRRMQQVAMMSGGAGC